MLSGDTTLGCDSWSVLSEIEEKKVFVFGSGSVDQEYCVSSGWELAPIEEASLIVARGTFTICDGSSKVVDKNVDKDEYWRVLDDSLTIAAQRQLPMLVTNPDKVRPDEGFPPMPGAIADAYAAKLDESDESRLIQRIGKPFPQVYQLALENSAGKKACMVGDALETDVTGGALNGITTVWVINDGIHGPAVAEAGDTLQEGAQNFVDTFNQKKGTYAKGQTLRPDVVLPHFRW